VGRISFGELGPCKPGLPTLPEVPEEEEEETEEEEGAKEALGWERGGREELEGSETEEGRVEGVGRLEGGEGGGGDKEPVALSRFFFLMSSFFNFCNCDRKNRVLLGIRISRTEKII